MLPSLRIRCAAFVVALLILAAAAPSAGAAAPRVFFGTQLTNGLGFVPQFPQKYLDRFQASRLGTLRMHFDWSAVQPHKGGSLDWTEYDRTVQNVTGTGTEILALLIGSPSYAAPRPTYPPRSRANIKRWRHFVHEAVARYGANGSFWKEHPELPYRPIRYWQVWNEPNYPRFWYQHPRVGEYRKLLSQTSPVIRRADPGATIVLGGLPNVANSKGQISSRMEDYLAALYRSSGRVRSYFDVVAIHPYSVDYRGVLGALSRIRSVMNRYGDRNTPIWITELGWASFNRGFNATSYSGQAKRLSQAFRALLRVRRRYRVKGVVWYAWRDERPVGGQRDSWTLHCGLFTVHDHAKPSWRAFERFTQATS